VGSAIPTGRDDVGASRRAIPAASVERSPRTIEPDTAGAALDGAGPSV